MTIIKTVLKSLFVIITFFSFQMLAQNTYYVSTNGNDSNDGSEEFPWLTIQGAINKVSVVNGDTIIVKDGTYNGYVDVNKEVIIQSENGYLNTTIISTSTTHHVFYVTASNVTINGFTTYGATSIWIYSGIGLYNVNNCTIINNRCGLDASHQNFIGIMLDNSDGNLIENNILSFNRCFGMNIRHVSDNNTISNNVITNNGGGGYGGYGIQNCENSVSNVVRANYIENNETHGIRILTPGINLGNNDLGDKGNNTIRTNGSYDVYNGTSNTINVYYNFWGSTDYATIDSHIYDNDENGSMGEVYFVPWLEEPFPVELTTFSASIKNNSVFLNWKTATEVNNYGFEIERDNSSDIGNKKWEKIGFVPGSGNSNSPKEYTFKDNLPSGTKLYYRLKQIDNNGQFEYSGIVEIYLLAIPKFELQQNYPNPFNPSTSIKYQVSRISYVSLVVYDLLGNEIETLVNEEKSIGTYEINWKAANLPSGVYFYQLKVGDFIQTKKMLYLK